MSSGSEEITLTAHGPRTVVTVEEAIALRSQWLALLERDVRSSLGSSGDAARVTAVDVGGRAWKVEPLRVLQDVFEQVSETVRKIKLDDIIASLDTETGLETLQHLAQTFGTAPNLETVDLSDNAIGTRGLEVLLPLFNVNADEGGRNRVVVQDWSFYNCGMSLEVAEVLKDVLLPHAHTLRALNLSRNQIGPDGAQHIETLLRAAGKLEAFEYAGSRPRKTGTRHLCQGLLDAAAANEGQDGAEAGTSRLRVLDLNDSILGDGSDDDDPVFLLCQLLRASPKLEKLVVKDGGLDCDGMAMVMDALLDEDGGVAPGRNSISHLDLGALCVGQEGAEKLAECLPQMKKLTHLSLETNVLEDDGVRTLLEAMAGVPEDSCQIEYLDLSDNQLTEDGVQAFLDYRLPSLTTLVLKENDFDDVSEELMEQLKTRYDTVVLQDDHEQEETSPKATAEAGDALDALATAMRQAHL